MIHQHKIGSFEIIEHKNPISFFKKLQRTKKRILNVQDILSTMLSNKNFLRKEKATSYACGF